MRDDGNLPCGLARSAVWRSGIGLCGPSAPAADCATVAVNGPRPSWSNAMAAELPLQRFLERLRCSACGRRTRELQVVARTPLDTW